MATCFLVQSLVTMKIGYISHTKTSVWTLVAITPGPVHHISCMHGLQWEKCWNPRKNKQLALISSWAQHRVMRDYFRMMICN